MVSSGGCPSYSGVDFDGDFQEWGNEKGKVVGICEDPEGNIYLIEPENIKFV